MNQRRNGIAKALLALVLLLAVALALPTGAGPVSSAQAQEAQQREGGGLLRFLFGRREVKQDRAAPQAKSPRRATTVRRSQPSQASAQATPQAVDKADDARRVLVIGDFLAGGMADGLVEAFQENATVLVVDRSNGSSGLVRDDYFDWPASVGPMLEEEKPVAVVVMIGSNDRQQMRVEGSREQPRSDAWNKEYERRVGALAKAARDRGLPLIWVGNLPFKSSSMSSDMIAFNDIYRRVVTDAGGEFVDVWDGFVDETGAFIANGPDMNGQPAQLRASDGINVTRQGRRKIAFYAEKPLNRLLGTPAEPGTALPPGAFQGPMPGDISPAEIDRTVPVAIDDPDLDGTAELLGAVVTPKNGDPKTPADRLTLEGVAPPPQPGRADDFSTKKVSVTGTTDPASTTALRP
jgi:hypothetical protein